jgi:hypothetical protein
MTVDAQLVLTAHVDQTALVDQTANALHAKGTKQMTVDAQVVLTAHVDQTANALHAKQTKTNQREYAEPTVLVDQHVVALSYALALALLR